MLVIMSDPIDTNNYNNHTVPIGFLFFPGKVVMSQLYSETFLSGEEGKCCGGNISGDSLRRYRRHINIYNNSSAASSSGGCDGASTLSEDEGEEGGQEGG